MATAHVSGFYLFNLLHVAAQCIDPKRKTVHAMCTVTKLNDTSLLHIVVHCIKQMAMHNDVQQRDVIQFGYNENVVHCIGSKRQSI